jgi:hypothetical protein
MIKKAPNFTLVRRSRDTQTQSRNERILLEHLRKQSKGSAKQFSKFNTEFARTLVSSSVPVDDDANGALSKFSVKKAARIVKTVSRHKDVRKVGILDLAAWVSVLPRLIQRLNAAQDQFTFFDVQAPVPAGLIKKGDWYADVKGFDLDARERKEISTQIYANEFFRVAEGIRANLGLDYLVGLTAAMVAGIEKGSLYWNHFSTGRGALMLVSTADLREYASKANRSFEALVGYVLLGQFLCATNPKLRFHSNRGCLFDYNADRVSIAKSAVNPTIEAECAARIEPQYRKSAQKLTQLLGKL